MLNPSEIMVNEVTCFMMFLFFVEEKRRSFPPLQVRAPADDLALSGANGLSPLLGIAGGESGGLEF